MSQLSQRENSPFLCLSVLFRSSMDWMMPNALVKVIFFTHLLVQMQISSRNTLTDHPEVMFYSGLGIP